MPLREQFTSSPEHEDAEFVCSFRLAQLRSHCPVKIGYDKYVAGRVTRDLFCIVARLKPFCLFTHTMADECSRDPASDCHVSSGEVNYGDHSVMGIAQTKIGNTVANRVRLLVIRSRRQHDDRCVSIGSRELVSLDIHKINCISRPC